MMRSGAHILHAGIFLCSSLDLDAIASQRNYSVRDNFFVTCFCIFCILFNDYVQCWDNLIRYHYKKQDTRPPHKASDKPCVMSFHIVSCHTCHVISYHVISQPESQHVISYHTRDDHGMIMVGCCNVSAMWQFTFCSYAEFTRTLGVFSRRRKIAPYPS